MNTVRYNLRKRLGSGEVLFGPWCVIPSADVANIIATAGFDFMIIDMEHGPFNIETALNMTRAIQAEGCSPLLRFGTIEEKDILHALDMGAEGIIAAHVESPEDAKELVRLARYYPIGGRGFSPYTRAGGFSGSDITQHAENQNNRTVIGVIIEGQKGIQNIDLILNVEHIDLVYIGAYDLSQALGIPGQVGDPRIQQQLEICIGKIREAGVAAGGFVAKNAGEMKWMIDMGMQIITYLPDCAVIQMSMAAAVDEFKSVIAGKGGRK